MPPQLTHSTQPSQVTDRQGTATSGGKHPNHQAQPTGLTKGRMGGTKKPRRRLRRAGGLAPSLR